MNIVSHDFPSNENTAQTETAVKGPDHTDMALEKVFSWYMGVLQTYDKPEYKKSMLVKMNKY